MLFKMIEDLYLEISNWLIQKIDADPDYDMDMAVDYYLMTTSPDEYALYVALEQMMRKIENNN